MEGVELWLESPDLDRMPDELRHPGSALILGVLCEDVNRFRRFLHALDVITEEDAHAFLLPDVGVYCDAQRLREAMMTTTATATGEEDLDPVDCTLSAGIVCRTSDAAFWELLKARPRMLQAARASALHRLAVRGESSSKRCSPAADATFLTWLRTTAWLRFHAEEAEEEEIPGANEISTRTRRRRRMC